MNKQVYSLFWIAKQMRMNMLREVPREVGTSKDVLIRSASLKTGIQLLSEWKRIRLRQI